TGQAFAGATATHRTLAGAAGEPEADPRAAEVLAGSRGAGKDRQTRSEPSAREPEQGSGGRAAGPSRPAATQDSGIGRGGTPASTNGVAKPLHPSFGTALLMQTGWQLNTAPFTAGIGPPNQFSTSNQPPSSYTDTINPSGGTSFTINVDFGFSANANWT